MLFIPFNSYVYKTNNSEKELNDKISKVIEAEIPYKSRLVYETDSIPFRGLYWYNGFKISRVINYRNSFLPVIVGEINGSNINISMRLNSPSLLIMLVWLLGSLIVIVPEIFSYISSKAFNSELASPFLYFIIAYIFITVIFKFESIKTKKIFDSIINKDQ